MRGKKKLFTGLIAAIVVALVGAVSAFAVGPFGEADRSAELYGAIDSSKPKNVILLIGDGTDEAMITAARNYELGAGGRLAMDDLPFVGDMTTYGYKLGTGPDYPIAYVSDSAPTATGWSTGHKTVDSRVGQGPSTALNIPGDDFESALEILADEGKLTGNITTSALTDATPAAAASHINARACQGPRDTDTLNVCPDARKVNGGNGSIAEQLVDNKVDVLMGGGYNRYAQLTDAGTVVGGPDEGQTVIDYAEETHGYRVIEDNQELEEIDSLEAGPVLGLFAGQTGSENMLPIFNPLVATAPPGAGGPAQRCTEADRGDQPLLSDMTRKAIDLLDNPNGFFLQVESAMVDKQEHASDICGAIGDLLELDRAIEVALAYQANHPDTLIITTGDHGHSTQIVPSGSSGKQTATLQTADGDPMSVAYSTQDVGSSHTGAAIRVAAKGPQAANVTGMIDQTDLFQTLLGREPSELPVQEVEKIVEKVVEKPVEKIVEVPAAPLAPRVAVATLGKIGSKQIEKQGLAISVAASGASSVRVQVKSGSKSLHSRRLGKAGGRFVLRRKLKAGKLMVKATASGPGGGHSASQRVTVTG